jgi:hypothetical protein
LSLIGVALYLHWLYAIRGPRLLRETVTPEVARNDAQRCLVAPAGYVVADEVVGAVPVLNDIQTHLHFTPHGFIFDHLIILPSDEIPTNPSTQHLLKMWI